MINCYSDVPCLSTGSLNLIWSQKENFAFVSSEVDCVSVNPSVRLDHVLRDAQKVCAQTKVGTVLNLFACLHGFSNILEFVIILNILYQL